VVHTRSHLIAGALPGWGPSHDTPGLAPVLRQAAALLRFWAATADAGYDAEHVHRLCREELGMAATAVALNRRTARRWPRTPYRRAMRRAFPRALYAQRQQVESVFSRDKRRLGAELTARSRQTLAAEQVLRVLTHNLLILQRALRTFQQSRCHPERSCHLQERSDEGSCSGMSDRRDFPGRKRRSLASLGMTIPPWMTAQRTP
jgi:hypothetical protein